MAGVVLPDFSLVLVSKVAAPPAWFVERIVELSLRVVRKFGKTDLELRLDFYPLKGSVTLLDMGKYYLS